MHSKYRGANVTESTWGINHVHLIISDNVSIIVFHLSDVQPQSTEISEARPRLHYKLMYLIGTFLNVLEHLSGIGSFLNFQYCTVECTLCLVFLVFMGR